jgi:hypothetical protein
MAVEICNNLINLIFRRTPAKTSELHHFVLKKQNMAAIAGGHRIK